MDFSILTVLARSSSLSSDHCCTSLLVTVVFLDFGYPYFSSLSSIIPVDVVGVKSLLCTRPMGVLITGRSSGCTLNGKGLSTGSGELNLQVMLLDSFVYQSYSFPIICKLCSIHRESCNHATLHSQVDRVFQSHQVWPLFGVSIVVADGGKVAPITLKILSPQCHGRYGLRHELCIRGWSPLICSGFVSTELIWRS